MFVRRNTDKLLIAIGILILVVVIGYRPEYHLRSQMPAAFFHEQNHANNKNSKSVDQKIASAYWESARMDVQWKYGYPRSLPPSPPPEFSVDAAVLGPIASDPALRMLYWHRLQQVWPLEETWKKEYRWRVDLLRHPLSWLAEWIQKTANRLFS